MPLDAENYYIQSGDLTEIELLKEKLDQQLTINLTLAREEVDMHDGGPPSMG